MTVAFQQVGDGEAPPPSRSRGGWFWQVVRRRPSAAVGVVVLGFFVGVAAIGPWLTRHGGATQAGPIYGRPSATHWLGFDDAGADMMTVLIRGARISLVVGVSAMAVSLVIGGTLGILAGYFGGATDSAIARLTDFLLVVPALPLMIVIAALWGPGLSHIIVVIGLLQWTWTARLVRAQVKSVGQRLYVKRSRSLGARHSRVLIRHVLPQIAPLLIALGVLSTAYAIFAETALAFLGLGDPTTTSWGTIIHRAFYRTAISSGAWWAVVPPGICVALVIIACHLVGGAVEDALNPRLKVAHLSTRRFRIVAEAPALRPEP